MTVVILSYQLHNRHLIVKVALLPHQPWRTTEQGRPELFIEALPWLRVDNRHWYDLRAWIVFHEGSRRPIPDVRVWTENNLVVPGGQFESESTVSLNGSSESIENELSTQKHLFLARSMTDFAILQIQQLAPVSTEGFPGKPVSGLLPPEVVWINGVTLASNPSSLRWIVSLSRTSVRIGAGN